MLRSSFEYMVELVEECTGNTVGSGESVARTVDVEWVGDASTTYGIGVAVGEYWAKFKYLPGWESNGLPVGDPKRKIAWAETVAVRLGLLLLIQLQPTRNRRFVVWTDNTTTEVEKRVTSNDNKVDDLSRGISTEWDQAKNVRLEVPYDLKNLLVLDETVFD